MKFKEDRPLVNPENAIEKLLKIANRIEADHAGRTAVAFRAVPHFGEGWRNVAGVAGSHPEPNKRAIAGKAV